jgi:hypothetical protein
VCCRPHFNDDLPAPLQEGWCTVICRTAKGFSPASFRRFAIAAGALAMIGVCHADAQAKPKFLKKAGDAVHKVEKAAVKEVSEGVKEGVAESVQEIKNDVKDPVKTGVKEGIKEAVVEGAEALAG